MTREIAEVIVDVRTSTPVVSLEDGQVWVSGMNSRPWVLAHAIAGELTDAGHEVGEPSDDDAVQHGGLILPVEGCEPISDEVYKEVFGDAEE